MADEFQDPLLHHRRRKEKLVTPPPWINAVIRSGIWLGRAAALDPLTALRRD